MRRSYIKNNEKDKIFFSFSEKDKNLVDGLFNEIKEKFSIQNKNQYFKFDEPDNVHENYLDDINKSLNESSHFIFFNSKNYYESPMCNYEYLRALELSKKNNIIIFEINLDNVGFLKPFNKFYKFVNYENNSNWLNSLYDLYNDKESEYIPTGVLLLTKSTKINNIKFNELENYKKITDNYEEIIQNKNYEFEVPIFTDVFYFSPKIKPETVKDKIIVNNPDELISIYIYECFIKNNKYDDFLKHLSHSFDNKFNYLFKENKKIKKIKNLDLWFYCFWVTFDDFSKNVFYLINDEKINKMKNVSDLWNYYFKKYEDLIKTSSEDYDK